MTQMKIHSHAVPYCLLYYLLGGENSRQLHARLIFQQDHVRYITKNLYNTKLCHFKSFFKAEKHTEFIHNLKGNFAVIQS